MTNPLLEKYKEIYETKVEEPTPQPKPEYPYQNKEAIYHLEVLLEELKTGKSIFQEIHMEPNHRCLPPTNPIDYSQPYLSPRYLPVYEGDLVTLKIFRRTR